MADRDAKKAALRCCELFDMHCHLGFCEDAAAAARELAAAGVGAFSNTVTPAEFAEQRVALADAGNVRVGVGLHPWWVGEESPAGEGDGSAAGQGCRVLRGPLDDGRLWAAMERTRFVGEVGLDLSAARAATREAQFDVFSQVVCACARMGGKVASLHAVHAVDEVLDALERAGFFGGLSGNAAVIHWFSGTSDQLTRGRRLGCFFSANPRMLRSKRGRAYVQAIPADRLLLETDAPSRADAPWDAADVARELEETLRQLAELRGEEAVELRERIAATSRELLGM